MDLDLDAVYKNYSNTALLKILVDADQYRPEAVDAANTILQSRNISDDDRRAAGYIIDDPVFPENKKSFGDAGRSGDDLLDPIEPDNELRSTVFFKVAFPLMVLFYLRLAYASWRSFYLYLKFHDFYTYGLTVNLLYALLIPFAMYQLYQKKRIGWFILFGENVWFIVPALLRFSLSWRYHFSHPSSYTIFFLLPVFIRPVIIAFLWQQPTTDYAGVSVQQKRTALLVFAGIYLALSGIIYFLQNAQPF